VAVVVAPSVKHSRDEADEIISVIEALHQLGLAKRAMIAARIVGRDSAVLACSCPTSRSVSATWTITPLSFRMNT
jgi:hypothetical protein